MMTWKELSTEPAIQIENCSEHWGWARKGARTFYVLVLREDGEKKRLKCLVMVGLQMLLFSFFLFFLLTLPSFYPLESL